jgi:MoaA/NifB/PqqE/SkfB family radical SAM enzyme
MPDDTFDKIIDDLAAIKYSNLLGLFNNNEPLLDKRLIGFIQQASARVPKATIYIFSNGELLDQELLSKLFDSGLRYIYLSIHDQNQYPKARCLHQHFGDDRIYIGLEFSENKPASFHNRGGNLTTGDVNQISRFDMGCELPFGQAVINPDGDMVLCCCDFYYDVPVGNVRDRPLPDIFYHSEKLNEIRTRLRAGTRHGLVLCEKCSHHGRKIYPKCRADNFFERQKKRLVWNLKKFNLINT